MSPHPSFHPPFSPLMRAPLFRPPSPFLKRPKPAPLRQTTTLSTSISPSTTLLSTAPATPTPPQCVVYDFPTAVPYTQAWNLQHHLVNARRKHPSLPDALILLEHEPVYTLGTASTLDHVLFDAHCLRRGDATDHLRNPNAPLLVRTERGGEVTYHAPGQLVVYPVLNLTRHKKDLHWYLRQLESVVISTLEVGYGIQGDRKEGLTGVWVGERKVCAMGLKVSRWISMHGFALNVCMDLKGFERIVPCGVQDKGVESLHMVVEGDVDCSIEKAKKVVLEAFCEVFGPYDIIFEQS